MVRCVPAVAAVLLVACGGSKTSVREPARDPASIAQAETGSDDDLPVDLAPVPEPADLQFVAHVPSAARWKELVDLLAGADPTLDGLLELEPREIAEGTLDPRLVELLDFSKPIHVSQGGAERNPKFAISLPLTGTLDTIRQRWAGEIATRRTAPGVWAIELTGRSARLACELRQSAGSVPMRMVCGSDTASVALHGAYLTRTLARTTTTALARVELPRGAFRKIVRDADDGEEVPLKESEKLGQKIGEQLLDEVDTLALEIDRAGDRLNIVLELGFRAAKTPFGVALTSAPSASAQNAHALWRMPKDAMFAWHYSGADRAKMRASGAPLMKALLEVVPDDVTDAQGRREMGIAAQKLFFTGGPITVAYGLDAARAHKALRDHVQKKLPLARARAATAGWTLVHVPEPAEHWRSGLRELLAADARASARVAGRPAAAQGGAAPQAPSVIAEDRYLSETRELPIRPNERLPAGALHIITVFTPNPRYVPFTHQDPGAGVRHENHVFMAPDGNDAWFAISDDAATALAKLREVLATKSRGTLKEEAELTSLQSERGLLVGFVRPDGAAWPTLSADSSSEIEESLEVLKEIEAVGSLAKLRWPFVVVADGHQPSEQRPVRVRVSTGAAKPAVTEIVRWVSREISADD